MACGRNENISWGITNNMVDASDLYMVEIINNTHYKYENSLRPLDIVQENITVKG
jgi:acyl-homoserine lactone acylase PvdQ